MSKQKKFKYLLMTVHLLIIVLTILFKDNKILSFASGGGLLCISLFTVVYMCCLAVNNDFYLQIIPIVYILMWPNSFGWDYVGFGDDFLYGWIIIIAILALSILVGLKCKAEKQKDCVVPTVAFFVFVLILVFTTTGILNVALSPNEPYTVEYELTEKTYEYDGGPVFPATKTYKVKPVSDSYGFDIEELEILQRFDVDTSDIVVVQIRKGLFQNVYKIIEKST